MPIIKNMDELKAMLARLSEMCPHVCPRKPETPVYGYYTIQGAKWKFYIAAWGEGFPNSSDGGPDPVLFGYADVDNLWMISCRTQIGGDFIHRPHRPSDLVFEIFDQPRPVREFVLPGKKLSGAGQRPGFVDA